MNHTTTTEPPSLKPWDLPCQIRPDLHTVSRGGRPTISTRIPVAHALYNEWFAMCTNRRVLRAVNGWGLPGLSIAHLDEILVRSGLDGVAEDDDADSYLAIIQRRAATDELAARVMLQRLLPAMLKMANKRGPIVDNGTNGAFEMIVSAAWVVIRRYPIDRRPVHVAGNLVRDIEYAAFVRDKRLKSSTEESVVGDLALDLAAAQYTRAHGGEDPVASVGEVEALLDDLQRLGLSTNDMVMLRTVMHDVNSSEIADELGINARSARSRRASALRRAREILTVSAEVADCSTPRTHSTAPSTTPR
jgi:hypothetical protein